MSYIADWDNQKNHQADWDNPKGGLAIGITKLDYCADAVCGSGARYSGASAPPPRATDSRAYVLLVGLAVLGLRAPWKYY